MPMMSSNPGVGKDFCIQHKWIHLFGDTTVTGYGPSGSGGNSYYTYYCALLTIVDGSVFWFPPVGGSNDGNTDNSGIWLELGLPEANGKLSVIKYSMVMRWDNNGYTCFFAIRMKSATDASWQNNTYRYSLITYGDSYVLQDIISCVRFNNHLGITQIAFNWIVSSTKGFGVLHSKSSVSNTGGFNIEIHKPDGIVLEVPHVMNQYNNTKCIYIEFCKTHLMRVWTNNNTTNNVPNSYFPEPDSSFSRPIKAYSNYIYFVSGMVYGPFFFWDSDGKKTILQKEIINNYSNIALFENLFFYGTTTYQTFPSGNINTVYHYAYTIHYFAKYANGFSRWNDAVLAFDAITTRNPIYTTYTGGRFNFRTTIAGFGPGELRCMPNMCGFRDIYGDIGKETAEPVVDEYGIATISGVLTVSAYFYPDTGGVHGILNIAMDIVIDVYRHTWMFVMPGYRPPVNLDLAANCCYYTINGEKLYYEGKTCEELGIAGTTVKCSQYPPDASSNAAGDSRSLMRKT